MNTPEFDIFRTRKLAEGFDEVLVREWAALAQNTEHTHPFDTVAQVVHGEFWLTLGGQTRHLQVGDTFQVGRGVPHSEHYGAQGATFWAARRN